MLSLDMKSNEYVVMVQVQRTAEFEEAWCDYRLCGSVRGLERPGSQGSSTFVLEQTVTII